MPTEEQLKPLVFNQVDTHETLEAMNQAGLVKDNEFYMVEEEDIPLLIDPTPTDGSPNLVSSGGVKKYVDNMIKNNSGGGSSNNGSSSGDGDSVPYLIGYGLKVVDDTLMVDSVNDFSGDNTLPATASLVQSTVGNIEALLSTI